MKFLETLWTSVSKLLFFLVREENLLFWYYWWCLCCLAAVTTIKSRLALPQRSLLGIGIILSWVWTHCLLLRYICLERVSCILSSHLLTSINIVFIIARLLATSKLFWLGKSSTVTRAIIVSLSLCHVSIVHWWVHHPSKPIIHMTSRLGGTSWLLARLLPRLWTSLCIKPTFSALCSYLIVKYLITTLFLNFAV